MKAAFAVEPDYLQAALAAIEERCGSVDAYLSDVMAIGTTKRTAIESHVLE
jgi:protein tyrosine/serine phosphatase